jgi:hypothetical protein
VDIKQGIGSGWHDFSHSSSPTNLCSYVCSHALFPFRYHVAQYGPKWSHSRGPKHSLPPLNDAIDSQSSGVPYVRYLKFKRLIGIDALNATSTITTANKKRWRNLLWPSIRGQVHWRKSFAKLRMTCFNHWPALGQTRLLVFKHCPSPT